VRFLICLLLLAAPAHAGPVLLRGHDARGHWFDLSSARGRMVVITFASRETEKDARTINEQLWHQPRVLVVSVVDMRSIPSLGRKLALRKVRESDRPNHLRHLIDKDGAIARGFGVDPRHHVDMFLVDTHGRLVGHFVGTQQLPDVQARLQRRWARRHLR
jgi:hypothetical protein